MGKFRQILTELPEAHPYFRFRMITWVNNKGFSSNTICIDIKMIWFGIANTQIS